MFQCYPKGEVSRFQSFKVSRFQAGIRSGDFECNGDFTSTTSIEDVREAAADYENSSGDSYPRIHKPT
jgi:hypothetical protein